MATQVQKWQSASGDLFDTERDACIADLAHMLSEGIGNDPIARQAAKHMADHAQDYCTALQRLAVLTPTMQERVESATAQ